MVDISARGAAVLNTPIRLGAARQVARQVALRWPSGDRGGSFESRTQGTPKGRPWAFVVARPSLAKLLRKYKAESHVQKRLLLAPPRSLPPGDRG